MGNVTIIDTKYNDSTEKQNCFFKKPIRMAMKDSDLNIDDSFAKPGDFNNKLLKFLKGFFASTKLNIARIKSTVKSAGKHNLVIETDKYKHKGMIHIDAPKPSKMEKRADYKRGGGTSTGFLEFNKVIYLGGADKAANNCKVGGVKAAFNSEVKKRSHSVKPGMLGCLYESNIITTGDKYSLFFKYTRFKDKGKDDKVNLEIVALGCHDGKGYVEVDSKGGKTTTPISATKKL